MIGRLQRVVARVQGGMMRALGVPEADGSIYILVAPDPSMIVKLNTDGTLTVQAPGSARFRLRAGSDATFLTSRTPWRLTFTKDETGNVVRVVANLEGTAR